MLIYAVSLPRNVSLTSGNIPDRLLHLQGWTNEQVKKRGPVERVSDLLEREIRDRRGPSSDPRFLSFSRCGAQVGEPADFPFQYFSCVCRTCVVLDWTKYQNNCLPPLLINMWPKYLWKPSDESIVVDSPKLVVQLGPGRERPYLQNKLVGRPPRWKWFRGKRTFLSDLLSKLWKRMKVFLFLYGTLHSWCCYY